MEEKLLQLFCIKDYSVKFFAKFCDFYTTEQSNFLMLHNFMKYFSDTRVNQIVNVWMVNCPVVLICYFQLRNKYVHKTFAL